MYLYVVWENDTFSRSFFWNGLIKTEHNGVYIFVKHEWIACVQYETFDEWGEIFYYFKLLFQDRDKKHRFILACNESSDSFYN